MSMSNMTDDTAWRAALKAGDEVWTGEQIERVERVTATQFVVGHRRFNRESGRQCGAASSWSRAWLHPVNDYHRNKVARRAALNQLKCDTSMVPTETLTAMAAMMRTALDEVAARARAQHTAAGGGTT